MAYSWVDIPFLFLGEVIPHAAAAQFVSLCSGMRQFGLWHSAMIRVRVVFVSLLRSRKLCIRGLIWDSASGITYPCPSTRLSFCCNVSVMCSSFLMTVSMVSDSSARLNCSSFMRVLMESRGRSWSILLCCCGSAACISRCVCVSCGLMSSLISSSSIIEYQSVFRESVSRVPVVFLVVEVSPVCSGVSVYLLVSGFVLLGF